MDRLDGLVTTHLADRLFGPNRLAGILTSLAQKRAAGDNEVRNRVETLQSEIAHAEDKLKRLYSMVEDGVTDMDDLLRERLAALKSERERAKDARVSAFQTRLDLVEHSRFDDRRDRDFDDFVFGFGSPGFGLALVEAPLACTVSASTGSTTSFFLVLCARFVDRRFERQRRHQTDARNGHEAATEFVAADELHEERVQAFVFVHNADQARSMHSVTPAISRSCATSSHTNVSNELQYQLRQICKATRHHATIRRRNHRRRQRQIVLHRLHFDRREEAIFDAASPRSND